MKWMKVMVLLTDYIGRNLSCYNENGALKV